MAEESLFAAEKVNVLIRAGACCIILLPQFGGKISSIRMKGRELLQAPLAPIGPRTATIPFDTSDASGWDECLPSVAACSIDTSSGRVAVPDHGDLWRVEWRVHPSAIQGQGSNNGKGTKEALVSTRVAGNGVHDGANSITMVGRCFSLPLELERTLTLEEVNQEVNQGYRLRADYVLSNTGSIEVPWSWAAHPLFAAAPGDRIVLPETIASLLVEGSGEHRLGDPGTRAGWPVAALAAGGTTDLSLSQPADSGIGDKLFAGPLAEDENWCALERPSAGVRIRFRFNPLENPYLGLWICYGGWPSGPGPKQTCVALEPATAPVDSLAVQGPWSRTLGPGQRAAWTIFLDLESM